MFSFEKNPSANEWKLINWNFTAINSQLNSHRLQQQQQQQLIQQSSPQQHQQQHHYQYHPTAMYHDMGYPAHSYATNYLTTPYSAEMMNSNVFGGGGSMVNGDVGDSFSPASPSSQYFLYGGLDGRKIDFGKMNESTTLSPLNPMMTMAPINNTNNNNNSPLPFNGRDATTTMLHHVIHPMAMTQTLVTENRGTWYQPPIGTGSQSDTR